MDDGLSGFPLLFIGFFEVISLSWVYGYSNFADDIRMMLGRSPPFYFRAMWCVITPLVLAGVIIFKIVDYAEPTVGAYTFPTYALVIDWLIVAFALFWFPFLAIAQMMMNGGWEVMKKTASPTPKWGPAEPENRTGRYAIDEEAHNGGLNGFKPFSVNGKDAMEGYINGGYRE